MAKFKTRARTVDMLGRQQIANASTAISELFKNAHDAYADHAEVDYFKSDGLMVIRDDGVGMTPQEFEDKWLVLGTESKLAPVEGKAGAYRPPGKARRAVMGEKGIGRLAIAALGRQALILTRANRRGEEHDLVMCLVHWGLFETPGVNLDDIEIPVRLVQGGGLPGARDVADLVESVRASVSGISGKAPKERLSGILDDLADFQVDPAGTEEYLGGLSLGDGRAGTHFYVVPAEANIAADIERERKRDRSRKRPRDFTKFLLGFSNSVFREQPPPPIDTAFRYGETDESREDLIRPGEFFTREELDGADHRVSGRFDEYGQFLGDVRIYDKDFPGHVIPWTSGKGQPTRCGPFEVEFGYVMGAQRESRLAPEAWRRITDKLDEIGGIYVYRDRIRILPYGNSDVDWLDIEERRTRSAGYYFFSYRRVFGAVKLTREENGNLKEKAGREGFQQDGAYRQLKSILENLFTQLAADFFRDAGELSEYYGERRKELERQELARRRREKLASTKRRKIASSLDRFFQQVNDGLPETELSRLRDEIREAMESASGIEDADQAAVMLLEAEKRAHLRLGEMRESYRVVKPRGVGLSKALQHEWNAYLSDVERLESELFRPFMAEVAQTLSALARETKLHVDQRKRLTALIEQQSLASRKQVLEEAKRAREAADRAHVSAMELAQNIVRETKDEVSRVEADLARRDLAALSDQDFDRLREDLESRISFVGTKNREILAKVRDTFAAVADNIAQGAEIGESDMVEAMDQELQELREQADMDAEMVQLGLAIAVINHEFEAVIKGVRRSLRELGPWARANEDLAEVYREIRSGFEHLDGHLNLFTPLQRRLYRKAIPIKGSDIHHYLGTLFDVRLRRHGIEMKVTDRFRDSEVVAFPSTIYPAFVNVVDNAIFWLQDVGERRAITLDADESGLLISNNGPEIRKRDRSAIFEQGFTRKPGGRGLGLFISRSALRKEGMDMDVVPNSGEGGVTMKLAWARADSASQNG